MTESLLSEIRLEIGVRRPCLLAALIMFASLLTGCATTPTTHTEVTGSWQASSFKGKFANLLVVSHAADPGIREKVESIMVTNLEKQGLHAVASSEIMPIDEKVNRETVEAAMVGKGFDGVLVSRLLDVNRSTVYVPPAEDATLENSFDARNYLYDAASRRLVWSAQSQTENFGTVDDLVQSVSRAIIKNLRAKGLI